MSNLLYFGDCLDVMKEIPSQSVDMVLADLPYGTTKCRWDSPIDLSLLWPEYTRICRGAVLLFAQTPFDKVLGASNLSMLRYEWIWEKSHATGHLNCNKMPMKAHENILVFYKKLPIYTPQKTSGHKRKTITKRNDKSTVYGAQDFETLEYDSTNRYPRSVLQFPSDKQTSKLHETQKPVDLCRYLLRTYSAKGDVVLDNVMGSGTTAIAALSEDRRFIGIEKDAAIFSAAKVRIEQFHSKKEEAQ